MPLISNKNEAVSLAGVDIGHGETSVSIATVSAPDAEFCRFEEPKPISLNERQSSIITAYAITSTGNVVIGDDALLVDEGCASHVGFKGIADDDRRHTQIYFEACIQKMTKLCIANVEYGKVQFVVGCPSGWSKSEREKYHSWLTGAALTAFSIALDGQPPCNSRRWDETRSATCCPVRVVPESRAALLEMKDSGHFTPEESKGSILVVDNGSSTSDVSAVTGLREVPEDFGDRALGGSLIEEELYRRYLRPSLDGADATYTEDIIRVRKAKENFFNRPIEFDEVKGYEAWERCGRRGLHRDVIFITQEMMECVLDAPQDKLGGRSWRAAFQELMQGIRSSLSAKGIAPAAIALTGGASRMPFLRQIVNEVFPEAKVAVDQQPELTVSRGLARIGRWDIYGNRFLEEVNAAIDSASFRASIRAAMTDPKYKSGASFLDDVTARFATAICKETVLPNLKRWRTGEIRTLEALQNKTTADAKELKVLKQIWTEATGRLNRDIIATIASGMTDPICKKYSIPASEIKLQSGGIDGEIPVPDVVATVLYEIISTIVLIIFVNLFGGAGCAIVPGPGGLLVGALIGAAIKATVADQGTDFLMKQEIPEWLRKCAVPDDQNPVSVMGDMGSDMVGWLNEKLGTNIPKTVAFRSSERLVNDMLPDVKHSTREKVHGDIEKIASAVIDSCANHLREQAKLALVHMS